jgi:hypothetical protein
MNAALQRPANRFWQRVSMPGKDSTPSLKNHRRPFVEDFDATCEFFFFGDFQKPARGFVHFFEGQFEGAVVHGDEMFGAQIFKCFHRLVGAHVDFAKGFRMVRADGQERDFGCDAAADFFEAVKVGAVARVINAAPLVFQNEAAVAAMLVAQGARAPMFAGREGDLPIVVGKTFPPIKLDDALEAEVEGEVAHTPGHDADFRMRQAAQGRFMKMIEVRVREQDEIDGRQVFDFQSRTLDAFQEKKPVGEIGIDEDVQVGELNQEGGVADPGDGDFALFQFWENRLVMLTGAAGQQRLPNHFVKKCARVEMFGGGEVLERLWQRLTFWLRLFWHVVLVIFVPRSARVTGYGAARQRGPTQL